MLVLDLDAATRELLVEAVGSRGHDVTAATSLEEAAALLARGGFDALIVKLRQAWAEPLQALLTQVAGGAFHQPIPQVLAVLLDDPPPDPVAWLACGVDDCAIALERGGEFELRLAALEKRLIARRRRLEEELDAAHLSRNYESLFHQAPAAVLVVSAGDGLVLEASDAAARQLGVAVEELRDKFLSLLVPGLAEHEALFGPWSESREPMTLTNILHERPDGGLARFAVETGRCFWSGQPAWWLRFEEVSAARRAGEADRREARRDAVRIMAAGAAQSLNDALTTVRGNLDLLGKQNTSRADAQELLDNAGAACEQAEATLRTLAGLARVHPSGGRRQRLDLPAWLPRVVAFAALDSQLQPAYDLPATLWPVEADEVLLKEAVLALVENAGLAQAPGGVLRLAARNLPATPERPAAVEIAFHNPGESITPDNVPRVFDPFFSTWPGRQGLGLARVQAVVLAHGGSVEIDSAPAPGTTIRVMWPAAAVAAVATPRPGPAAATPAKAPGRVLVMDDDAGIRIIVEKMLTLQGFDVYTVRDGREAIAAYRRALDLGSPFDVVLLDLEVRGGMGGRECIARMRGEFKNVKALLSTGALDDVVLENHREHGFSGVITKPFNIERLVGAVARLAEA